MTRAVGDSRTPLYFLVFARIMNIALDYLFILVFDSGVMGAGIATVIAQFFSGAACIPVMKKRFPLLALEKKDFRVDRAKIVRHIRIALPVGFQWSVIAIGAVAVTFALNGLGYAAVAAFTTGQKIDQLAPPPLSSYGQAMTTFAARNFGAKKYGRIKNGVTQGLTIALGFSVFILL